MDRRRRFYRNVFYSGTAGMREVIDVLERHNQGRTGLTAESIRSLAYQGFNMIPPVSESPEIQREWKNRRRRQNEA